jgi:hypothetical protein
VVEEEAFIVIEKEKERICYHVLIKSCTVMHIP